MGDIEKMMQNAGVKKLLYCDICKAQEHALGLCAETKCEPFYPPFTAEKQVAILQALIFSNKVFSIGRVYPHNIIQINNDKYVGKGKTVGEAFAEIINKLWQDLTEEEKQQVKGILE